MKGIPTVLQRQTLYRALRAVSPTTSSHVYALSGGPQIETLPTRLPQSTHISIRPFRS